ncbi:MAG: YaeQ family protein [Sulfuricurvum sp.]|uniref:YaeQ family protein n=1 Tax=Sulfuricurvum sp. TaxID=2025608 RepID=UPI0025E2FE58|nr:YaeQ family protein [Sulfuricurvum sp.]MCK9373644.1 YaeQ family protein [Sulfuricurvum sp.]
MAAGSTVYKVQLTISDTDRHYYETHEITIAQHPSETDERLMIRLAAFALNATDRLIITKGIGGEDEPDLWEKNYGGEIELWIDLGQVDEKRLRKACGRSERVRVYTYNTKSATAWWRQYGASFARFKNLTVIHLNSEGIEKLCERSMRLQCTISDGELSMHSERGDVEITQTRMTPEG